METGKCLSARGRLLGTCVAMIAAWSLFGTSVQADGNASQTPTKRISAEDFGALPFMTSPKISPDGTLVASRAYVRDGLRLIVVNLDQFRPAFGAIPIPEKRDLLWYRWAGNDRLLISIGKNDMLDGEEVYVTRLILLDLKNSQAQFVGKGREGVVGDDVIYVAPDGSYLLLSIQETVFDYPSVWRVDLATLKMKRVVSQKENVWSWFADPDGVVRAGIGSFGKRWWLLYRKNADDDFKRVVRHTERDEEQGNIEKFVMDGTDTGLVIANTKNARFGLYKYDFTTDTVGDAIYEHPSVDIDDVVLSSGGSVLGVRYTDDRSRIEWFDEKLKQWQAKIDKALPDHTNRMVSFNADESRIIVWSAAASDPGRYFFFEPSKNSLRVLSEPYDHVDGASLSRMESTSYHARDGLEIPAYVTLPQGLEAKNLPLVVMPHGGPFYRDEWGYDSWVQFLANRGYAVLQPNFRGSTGYGKEYVQKGMGQWGRAMQDDIDDGAKWLVDQGKVDPKRICIMGASFGGYAAMWAAVRNPDIYRCAISFAGVSDVGAMLRYDRRSMSATRYYRNWRDKVQGDKDFDLATISPLRAADKVAIPLLIAHGNRDDNVPPSQSVKFHELLTKANKPHEFVLYEGEGHGFESPANNIDFLKRVEAFLEKYNPPGDVVAKVQ
ncbi:MAG TPA: S9 family peptidase [Steroidobacteraceae bacterium]|nr:S9 family peptidase [Steroidobacteraceae bacterium]